MENEEIIKLLGLKLGEFIDFIDLFLLECVIFEIVTID